MSLCTLQCMMLMETLFGADGLGQLLGNVVKCARTFKLHGYIRFVCITIIIITSVDNFKNQNLYLCA